MFNVEKNGTGTKFKQVKASVDDKCFGTEWGGGGVKLPCKRLGQSHDDSSNSSPAKSTQ